jgi:hypothetical protein
LLNIVTAADKDYFKFLPEFIEQTRLVFPDAKIYVYDLGMTYDQLYALDHSNVSIRGWRKVVPKDHAPYPIGYTPRALHKPSMLYNLSRHADGPIVYMDVDAYPVNYFKVPDCDVAVTMKRKDQMAQHRGTPLAEYLGKLDAGVIMFGPDAKRGLFLAKWVLDMQNDDCPSDQKSLNNVVGECHDWEKYNVTRQYPIAGTTVRVHILHEGEYNSSFMHPDAKILHLRVHEQ